MVSPINARRQLSEFIEGAREELLIYDPKISDSQMIRLLKQQNAKGVKLRVIGRMGKAGGGLAVQKPQCVFIAARWFEMAWTFLLEVRAFAKKNWINDARLA